MTRVTLYRTAEGSLCGFSCEGHAGYADKGNDIVCAAVSALAITCCNALESIAQTRPETQERDGLLTVRLAAGQLSHDAQVILRVFEQGICDIASTYPRHISVTGR